MADFGAVPGRKTPRDNFSVDVLESLCAACSYQGSRQKGIKYCVTCEEYLCSKCVTNHYLMPLTSKHVIEDTNNLNDVEGSGKPQSVLTERCPDHPRQILDMYCKTHSKICCKTCLHTKHFG